MRALGTRELVRDLEAGGPILAFTLSKVRCCRVLDRRVMHSDFKDNLGWRPTIAASGPATCSGEWDFLFILFNFYWFFVDITSCSDPTYLPVGVNEVSWNTITFNLLSNYLCWLLLKELSSCDSDNIVHKAPPCPLQKCRQPPIGSMAAKEPHRYRKTKWEMGYEDAGVKV